MSAEKIKDGGPAFPTPNDGFDGMTYGMSLRDWFAGQALSGFIARCATDEDWARLPLVLYEMADAMLKAREAQS